MFRLIKLIIWIAIITIGIFAWNYHNFQTQKMCIDFVDGYFEVEKGETFRTALKKIYDNELFLKIYLKQNIPDFELQAGKYELACGDIYEVIESLRKPMNESDEQITFLEGWNIFDIDAHLEKKGLINAGDFISYSENFCNPDLYPESAGGNACDLKYDFVFLADAQTLEGFLYPDTYAINPNSFTVKGLATKMLQNFETKVIDSGVISDMGSIELLDVINLASIVEKEERNPEERPTVAGILKKRLNEGWMIGADITVCYPFRLTSEQCKLSVTKYLYEKNEYNTRQMIGLPAGPIGNPSVESIAAVINPLDSPYYYYLHDTLTGEIYYGETNAEHERNKQLYLR